MEPRNRRTRSPLEHCSPRADADARARRRPTAEPLRSSMLPMHYNPSGLLTHSGRRCGHRAAFSGLPNVLVGGPLAAPARDQRPGYSNVPVAFQPCWVVRGSRARGPAPQGQCMPLRGNWLNVPLTRLRRKNKQQSSLPPAPDRSAQPGGLQKPVRQASQTAETRDPAPRDTKPTSPPGKRRAFHSAVANAPLARPCCAP